MERMLLTSSVEVSMFCGGGGGVCVRDLDQESMTRISQGSHNLTKLKEITSSICRGFQYDHYLALVGI